MRKRSIENGTKQDARSRPIEPPDRSRIEEIVVSSGNFNREEIATALELVDEAAALAPLDPAPVRARQVFRALYERDALDPRGWTEFPAALREAVAGTCIIARPLITTRALATDGTLKCTLDLPAGGRVEAVAIREPDRTTFCISSQVGSPTGARSA